ncbi:MAG: DUF4065 domain-containing protein [Treponema sp.]|jgi:uncharacterized phage-associated protein|nr:DUF4065 domain-containing protein [Treponema sp.]
MASAGDVAKYLIKSLPVDNLKLQKLLYYSQAVHIVSHNKTPLFPEAIEAWDYGPVVPEVYREYKAYGFDIIPGSDDPSRLSLEEMKSIDLVIASLGEMSGPELINQTHREAPWRDAYCPGRPSRIISLDSMYEYFKENLDLPLDAV